MASFRIRLPDPGSGPSDARSVAGSESSRTSAASSGVSSVGDGGVADLVRRLVRKVTANPATGEPHPSEARLLKYVLRILGSRLSASVVDDPQHAADGIKKRLASRGRIDDALRLSSLSTALIGQNVIRAKWAILHVLSTVARESPSGGASGDGGGAAGGGNQAGLGETQISTVSSVPHLPLAAFSSVGLPNVESYGGRAPASAVPVGGGGGYAPAHAGKDPRAFLPSSVPQPTAARNYGVYKDGAAAVTEVSEAALLRDVLFAFQGIEGVVVKYSEAADGFVIDPSVRASPGTRDLVRRLCELGWLFRRVQWYAQAREGSATHAMGFVAQAFFGAVQDELGDYYRLVAVLEARIGGTSLSSGELESGSGGKAGGVATSANGPARLTLRQLLVWTRDPLQRMRMIATLTDAVRGLHGGALLSALHAYVHHGNPKTQTLIRDFLERVSRPLWRMVWGWALEGVLEDPYHEFFVGATPGVGADLLWHEKYAVRSAMIPAFLPDKLVNRILLLGKAHNFLRLCCADTLWGLDPSFGVSAAALAFDDLDGVARVIDGASEVVNDRLRDAMFTTYSIFEHFGALKRYIFLGQGDFVLGLMDLLKPELEKPASQVFRHNMLSVLETAIRSSLAQEEEESIIARLDVRLLEASVGDTGWDIFALDYAVDAPISTVLHGGAMHRYHQVFTFLWRLKRVEASLSRMWGRQMTCAHSLRAIAEIQTLLNRFYVVRNEMVHFIQNFQHYIMFEVEGAWTRLVADLAAAPDMDAIIAAHDTYLDVICEKAFLTPDAAPLLAELSRMFVLILDFVRTQDVFYDSAMEEVQRRKAVAKQIERRTEAGDWGLAGDTAAAQVAASSHLTVSVVPAAATELATFSETYEHIVGAFLRLLTDQTADHSLRELSFRLDFNGWFADHGIGTQAGRKA